MTDERYKQIKSKEVKTFIDSMPEVIKQRCQLITIKADQIIALKGNLIQAIYINLQGEMQVKNEFENGFVYSFAKVDQLAYIGVMELMAQEPLYVSSVQTMTDCLMIKIDQEDFMNWVKSDHAFTLQVLHFVARIMYVQSVNKGEALAYPAIYSLMSYLITVYESGGSETVYLTKTREEIGSILGFSMRTINRNLKQLKEQACLTVSRKYLSINQEQYQRLLHQLQTIK